MERLQYLLVLACAAVFGGQIAAASLTGLALPPLEVPSVQAFGSWASANSLVFTDLMKHSGPFAGARRPANNNRTWDNMDTKVIAWRPDGYPAGLHSNDSYQWSVVTVIGAGKAYYKAGRYVVLYDGQGAVELDGDAAQPPLSSAPGRVEVDIAPNTTLGLRVRITSSSPANPLVNLRIVPAAYESTYNTTQVFHPDFLDMLKGIPLLRFAAWMRATGNDNNAARAAPRDWAARTTPLHASQVREADGVAVEHMVQLANTVNASMWINLPRAANDSDPYTYGMVSYIARNLLAHLNLTVEYGTDGPGWLSTNLPVDTRLISGISRRAWADAGRPPAKLRIVMTAPSASVLGNLFGNVPGGMDGNWSFIDAIAMPASFGSQEYWVWSGRPNPTSWASPKYSFNFRVPSLQEALKLIRSSVIAADAGWNRNFQLLRSLGIPLLGYAAGPDLVGPSYGARSNYDNAWRACGRSDAIFPCTLKTVYPPMTSKSSDGPKERTWATRQEFNASFFGELAANASNEAALESVLRQARLHDGMYDMVLDSLWRWHSQMGGGDLVIDLTRRTTPCDAAPGAATTPLYVAEECKPEAKPNATEAIVGRPTETPTYRALMAWLAAVGPDAAAPGANATVGALPRSAAAAPPAVPAPRACSPACVYGSCVNGTCACWAGVSGAACATLPPRSAAGTPSACSQRVGMNLEGIADWSRSWTFVDVFKASRAWIPQSFRFDSPWSTGAAIQLINSTDGPGGRTAVGYPAALLPGQRVSTLVVRDLATHVPGGVYTVLYDGKGVLDFSMSDVLDAVHVEAGHAKVTFRPSTDLNNGIAVTIERTDPTDPIRNIRVIMPGYEQASEYGNQPFHPALLWYLRPFGMLRFMDWMNTNGKDTPREWEERPLPQDRSYAVHPGGVPVEYMVLLCNMIGADAWVNIPYAASDDYITKFARAMYDGLRPDLKVYVEYGNELWGAGFPGGQYAQAMGLKMNLTEDPRWGGGAVNEARLCFAGQRTANISRIWKAVWGPDRSSSVVAVVSGQAVWPITSSKLLSCGNAHNDIDALAIAPYFGTPYKQADDTNLTKFMEEALPSQIDDTLRLHVAPHAAIAKNFSKMLITYGSGQGLRGDGSSNDLAIQAQRHPAMAGLYRKYMRGLSSYNVSRIMHYTSVGAYTKHGSWGLMEAMDWDKRDAPKYQGLMSFLNSSLTCALLPLAPDPRTCPGGCSGNGECLPGGKCLCYNGYSGVDCNTTAFVEIRQCGYDCTFGQGTCGVSRIEGLTRYWSCTCKPGITGRECTEPSPSPSPLPPSSNRPPSPHPSPSPSPPPPASRQPPSSHPSRRPSPPPPASSQPPSSHPSRRPWPMPPSYSQLLLPQPSPCLPPLPPSYSQPPSLQPSPSPSPLPPSYSQPPSPQLSSSPMPLLPSSRRPPSPRPSPSPSPLPPASSRPPSLQPSPSPLALPPSSRQPPSPHPSPRPSPLPPASSRPPLPAPPLSASQPALPYCSLSSTASLLSQLNAGAATCDPAADASSSAPAQCGSDSVCTAVQGCLFWACDVNSQSLVQVSCSGRCQPRTLTLGKASISDDGLAVYVGLSARAAPLVLVPCTTIFDAGSVVLLGGGGALCRTIDDDLVLEVQLPANATLQANATITLRSPTEGQKLVGALDSSRAFTGSAVVRPCTSCALPIASISGPSIVSRNPCVSAAWSLLGRALATPTAAFDASGSLDPSRRTLWAAVRWELVPSAGVTSAASSVLQAAIGRANGRSDVSNRLVLQLNATELAALPEEVSYVVQVRLTSWLGTAAVASHGFKIVASNPAPVVSIAGARLQTFKVAAGVRLSAEVVEGGCTGRTLTWNWTSPSGWSGLPPGGVAAQQLALRGPVSAAVPGREFTVRVTAAYSGASAAEAASAVVVLRPEGSPPLASLVGPSGDVPDNTPLLLNATASYDPDDAANPRQALSYQWECRREDYPLPCFTSSQQGDRSSTPGLWTIPAGLLTTGRWHIITVTVVKNGSSSLTASASVTFRPRSASQPFPRGTLTRQCSASACLAPHSTDRDLLVLLQLASPYNTNATAAAVSVTWASPEAPAVSGLTAATAATRSDLPAGAFLLTVPAATLPAYRSSITITAALTAAEIDGAAAATGSASITVQLNGAPYCGLNATDAAACLAVTVLDSKFPYGAVVLRARGWADDGLDDRQLKYEYGVRRSVAVGNGATATTELLQERGAAKSATLVGLPQGVVQLYGCAIDESGARTCGRVAVTVDPPAAGFNATAALAAVNMTELVAANDQRTLLQAANQAAQLAAAAINAAGTNATALSNVLGDLSVALVRAVLNSGSLADGEQAPQAIAAMASLASSVTALPAKAQDAFMLATMSAVQTLPGGNSSSSSSSSSGGSRGGGLQSYVTHLCRLLGAALPQSVDPVAPLSIARRRAVQEGAAATSPTASETARLRLKDMLAASDRLGDALGRQAAPRTPYLASGDGGVFVSAAAIPDAPGSDSAATTVVQLAAGAAAVAGRSTGARRRQRSLADAATSSSDAEAQLVLVGAAAAAASGYGIDLQYAPSSAVALSAALSGALPASVTLLDGGLTTVTWNADAGAAAATAPVLDGTDSYLLLILPAPGYDPSRPVACLLYNVTSNTVAGDLSGLTAASGSAAAGAAPSYDSTSGRVTCRTKAVGSYLVAQGQAAAGNPTSGQQYGGGGGSGGRDGGLSGGELAGVIVGSICGCLTLVLIVASLVTRYVVKRAHHNRVVPA